MSERGATDRRSRLEGIVAAEFRRCAATFTWIFANILQMFVKFAGISPQLQQFHLDCIDFSKLAGCLTKIQGFVNICRIVVKFTGVLLQSMLFKFNVIFCRMCRNSATNSRLFSDFARLCPICWKLNSTRCSANLTRFSPKV